MKLHCLGTTGFHPSPTRHTACYYLPELDLVLDAGTGIFRLVEHLLQEPKRSIDILLSHAHLDHVVGLTFLVDALAVTELEQIRLIGEAEKLRVVREHLYHELLFPVPPTIEFVALPADKFSMDYKGGLLQWFPLNHPGGSIGYCWQGAGRKFSYVTDTVASPDDGHLDLITDSDLLLHECYFGDAQQELAIKTGHSWLAAVKQVVRETSPKQAAMIHINPLAEVLGSELQLDDECRQLNMFVAEDLQEINF